MLSTARHHCSDVMKTTIIILLFFSFGFCELLRHYEKRYVGIVTEVKLIDIKGSTTYLWIKADKDFIIKDENHIPFIYVGDSLFEYWLNYRQLGVGTSNNINIYKVDEK